MRIAMVCPYSWSTPGGVQNHVRGLSDALRDRGHEVSVLAPSADDELGRVSLEPVVSAGRAVPLRYNGSVARLAMGPGALARTRRWLRDGGFDLLHVHDPATPSISLMALVVSDLPVVATIHTSIDRSHALRVTGPLVRVLLAKAKTRIAVSEHAREVVERYQGGGAYVVPNGLRVDEFAGPVPDLPHDRGSAPRLLFLGRYDEPRKGLAVLLDAYERLLAGRPGATLVVAGSGSRSTQVRTLRRFGPDRVRFTGRVDDAERARLLGSCDAYVAPNTGGESFGIVLIEAMAAGAAVVASDIGAFSSVLDGGRFGELFANRDSRALAGAIARSLDAPDRDARLARARKEVRRYDWSSVAPAVEAAYRTALEDR